MIIVGIDLLLVCSILEIERQNIYYKVRSEPMLICPKQITRF